MSLSWHTYGRVQRLDRYHSYNNANGSGYLFTFAIEDEQKTMECIAFGKHAEVLAKTLTMGKVYTFRNVRLSKRKPGYATLDAPFQIQILDSAGVMEASADDAARCARNTEIDVNLIEFSELSAAVREGVRLDVLGILIAREEKSVFASRSSEEELQKSGLILEDAKGNQLAITLWNEQVGAADALELQKSAILLDLHGELRDDGLLVLTAQHSTTFHVATSYDEGAQLETIFNANTDNRTTTLCTAPLQQDMISSAPLKMVSTISLAVKQRVETTYFRVLAFVTLFPYAPNFYLRCPTAKCGAKVVKTLLGRFDCSKCHAATKTPTIGLALVLDIQDYTGSAMLTVFNEAAASFLNRPLAAAKALYTTDKEGFDAMMAARRFVHMEFRVSVTKDAQGTFAARCWSIRPVAEQQLKTMLMSMEKGNDACVFEKSVSLTTDSI